MKTGEEGKTFRARLEGIGPGLAWVMVKIPFDVHKAFGSRARVPVSGTINDFAFRSSLFPSGDGTHHMMVNKQMQQGAGARPGDRVRMTLRRDDAPREVEVPQDLARALRRDATAKAAFAALAPSVRKQMVDAILQARKPETRIRRIQKALAELGRKP